MINGVGKTEFFIHKFDSIQRVTGFAAIVRNRIWVSIIGVCVYFQITAILCYPIVGKRILAQHLRDNMGEIITLIDAAANENGYNQE